MANCSKLNICEDTLEEILLRLPHKSLMRFKCVSTLWCSVIQNPRFLDKHRRASGVHILLKHSLLLENNNIKENQTLLLSPLFLCNGINDDVSTVVEDFCVPPPLNQIDRSWDLEIVGHCDGIICLKLLLGNVVLCNPTIKEFKLLPKSSNLLPDEDYEGLVFELDKYTDYLGFGYDCKAKDYKVVRCVVFDEASYLFSAEVYTLGSDSWREIETKYTYRDHIVHGVDHQVYFEGVYYWQIIHGYIEEEHVGGFILSFDMSDELFNEILVPLEDMRDGTRWWLGVWKESIALITYPYPVVSEAPRSFDIWVKMNDSSTDAKDSWTKCFTIEPTEGVELPLLSPLVFWKSDKLLMVTDDGRVVSYNLGTNTIKYLPIHFVEHICDVQAVTYTNTSVSVEGGSKLEGIDNSAFYCTKTLPDGKLRSLR